MSDTVLIVGGITSLVLFAYAAWWWRNGFRGFRAVGSIIFAGSGVNVAYIVIRTLVER